MERCSSYTISRIGENVFANLRKKLEKIVKKVLTNGLRSGILSELSPRGAVGPEDLKSFPRKSKKGLDKVWKMW